MIGRRALVSMVIAVGATSGSVRAQFATDFRWRQVLTSHRLGDRLTALEVDPTNAKHLFVGTEAGTLFRTRDGGVTWEEFALSPANVDPRSAAPPQPFIGFRPQGPSYDPVGAIDIEDPTSDQDLIIRRFLEDREAEPEEPPSFMANRRNIPGDLLAGVLTPRQDGVLPVVWIDYCPGGRYPLLVATNRDVFGSDDDGRTFIRLFQQTRASIFVEPGVQPVNAVLCSPIDPDEIVVSTSRGLLWSKDGGLSYTEYIVGSVPGPTTAVAFDEAGAAAGHRPNILVGQESLLFIGNPDSNEGLQYTYPNIGAIGNAPYSFIRWITVTPSAQIWMATDNGPRASLNGGNSWFKPGSRLFNQDPVKQIEWGFNQDGGERVAIVVQDGVWTTDDSARHFEPFFRGVSRRSISMVKGFEPDEYDFAQWWVLTTGELWTNKDPTEGDVLDGREEVREWAEDRIVRTRPLWATLFRAYELLGVSSPDITGVTTALRRRNWMPIIEARFEWNDGGFNRDRSTLGILRQEADTNQSQAGWSIFAEATWFFPDAVFSNPVRVRQDLIDLQKQVGFVVEDAWHERMSSLLRLAEGQMTVFQAEILRARIEALEGVMSVWVGEDGMLSGEAEGDSG